MVNPDQISLSSTPRFDLRLFSIILEEIVAFASRPVLGDVCTRRHANKQSMQGSTGEFPSGNTPACQ